MLQPHQNPEETIEVVGSALEIYNEELRDLANPSTPSRAIMIREVAKVIPPPLGTDTTRPLLTLVILSI